MSHPCRRKATFLLLVACVPMTIRPPDATAQAPANPPLPAAAPTVRRLTLEEAKQLALNNKALALARLNLEEKGYAADAASKDYFPKLMGSSTYFHFDKDLGSVVTVERGRRGILTPAART